MSAIDSLSIAILLLSSTGTIVCANRAAEQILVANDGITVDKTRLLVRDASQNRKLSASIASSALTAGGTGLSSGACVAVARPSGKRPFTVVTMPLSPDAFPLDAKRPTVIVLIRDPEAKIETTPEILMRVYGLTSAESGVAAELMSGETLVRAAERLGVSHNTVRAHLRSIYAKTGTHHQAELVKFLLTVARS